MRQSENAHSNRTDSKRTTNACVDESVGKLIARYEMNMVDDEERDLFEDHLQYCDYCLQELNEMAPILDAMLRHRDAIIESIERRGISLNLGKTTVPVLSRFQYLRDILSMRSVSQVFGKLRHSWVWQSACLGIISLVGLIALGSTLGNPYGSLNERQLGLFKVGEPYRGTLTSEADSLFLQGENHYHGHQASLAIKELRRADELWGLNPKRPELYPRTRARYYLALCHLDLNRPTVAIEYLNWIVEQGDKTEYYEKARDKLERVLQIKKRIEQRQFKVWQWQFIRDLFHPKE